MIVLNNIQYKYLTDKIYIGGIQIGKVYKGSTLIYPEPTSTPTITEIVMANQVSQGGQATDCMWVINIDAPSTFSGNEFTNLQVIIVEVPSDYQTNGVYPRIKVDVLAQKCYKNTYISTSNTDRNVANWEEVNDSSCQVYTSNLAFGFSIHSNDANANYVISAISANATNCHIIVHNTFNG